jgi:hypothetical protein
MYTRTHARNTQEPLQRLEQVVLKTGATLQSLLRFLVLCTRHESRKCQGRAGSVTAGYNATEDAEAMRKFLCEFTCEPGGVKTRCSKQEGASGGGQVARKRTALAANGNGVAKKQRSTR